MKKYSHLISGEFVEPCSGKWFETVDPYTGKAWALIARGDAADVNRAVESAHHAFTLGPWSRMSASERGLLLHRFGDIVAREAARLAEIEVRDNGKLLAEMQAQCAYMANWYHYYGGLADKIEGSMIPVDREGFLNFTRHEPVGVVAAITPWNSPLFLAAWKLAPALAAGCTVVLKPSEFTSASSLELGELALEAGFPPGVINVVTGLGSETASLVTHPLVRKIAFTGSDATGRAINEVAARDFKRVGLELGGKSPNIVFDDADIDAAANGAISGIFAASGQTCIAGSRLLLQEGIHDRFVDKLVKIAAQARMGNPMLAATQVGPITTRAQYEKVLSYIEIARKEGARLLCGGATPTGGECANGWFVEPTLFVDVSNRMRIAQEEVFGPVLSIIKFKNEDEAVAIANDIRFGLAAGIWTEDIPRGIRVAQRIEAGIVWVNTYRAVSFMSPFGGYKDSGVGRENGMGAIRDFLETKSVWMNVGAAIPNPFTSR